MLLQAGERVEENSLSHKKAQKAQKFFRLIVGARLPSRSRDRIRFISRFIHFSATIYKDFLNKCSFFRTR